jgi:hypothetical protein
MAFPPEQFPWQDLAQNQQHKWMSLECFYRLSFIIPNTPKKKKKELNQYLCFWLGILLNGFTMILHGLSLG